ncbi:MULTISPECIES: hypothetical protein [Sphingobium]|uniref:hypothetical protein n=1 Tax=Sphingobium sp. MI1205 TaxID=407020 RepID=UPI00077033A2|nr:hypothetical protein K663_07240 [Sphingobium sp. MI1205]
MANDDATACIFEVQDQLVTRLSCGSIPSAALPFPENGLNAEAKIAGASGDYTEAVVACLMPALEKANGRYLGRIRNHAAFDRRALQAGR